MTYDDRDRPEDDLPDDGHLAGDKALWRAVCEEYEEMEWSGPHYAALEAVLVPYGLTYFRRVLRHPNEVDEKLRQLGVGFRFPEEGLTPTERDTLLHTIVHRGVLRFRRKAFVEQEWDPDRDGARASLRTYFVNTTYLQIPNAHREIERLRSPRHEVSCDPADLPETCSAVPLPSSDSELTRGVAEAGLDDTEKEVIRLTRENLTPLEIAERLGVSESTARRARDRGAEKIRRWRDGRGGTR